MAFFVNHQEAVDKMAKPVIGAHGKRAWRGVGRKGWQRVGERLAQGWHRVGEGLTKGWQRVGGFPCILHLCNSRGAHLEDRVCDSMEKDSLKR